jgi:hypothetical protein
MRRRYLSRREQIVEEYFDSVAGDEDWSPGSGKKALNSDAMTVKN